MAPRANASDELVWGVVRDTSSFRKLRKVSGRSKMGRRGTDLTTEPNNLTGKNSWKSSGLANSKAVGITAAADGGIVLTTKSRKSNRVGKPAKAINSVTLSKGGFGKVAKSISKLTHCNFYRPDLTKAALAKWSLIHKSQKKK